MVSCRELKLNRKSIYGGISIIRLNEGKFDVDVLDVKIEFNVSELVTAILHMHTRLMFKPKSKFSMYGKSYKFKYAM